MAFDLRKEVEELRKRGASLGLNQDDIDYAVLKSLGETQDPQSKTPKRKPFSLCKCVFVVMATTLCVLFLIIGGLMVASERDKQFALLIGRTFADWHYPIVRAVRLWSLPLHTWFNMSHLYAWECIVDNPSYQQDGADCEICINAKRVPIKSSHLLSQEDFKSKFFDPGFSVIIRNVSSYGDKNHTFEEFLDIYHLHKDIINKDACQFFVGGKNNTVRSLDELLNKWDHYKPEGHIIGWKFCYGKGFREVRKLYPRPYFVHSEGSLEKVIQLLQPSGTTREAVELPRTSFDNVWYAQVNGVTEVQLEPVDSCREQCKSHTIQLIQGDVLFFTQQIWKATFTNEENVPAMIFVSSFS